MRKIRQNPIRTNSTCKEEKRSQAYETSGGIQQIENEKRTEARKSYGQKETI